jgi:hypothetical protein
VLKSELLAAYQEARAVAAAAADGFIDFLAVVVDASEEHPPLEAVEAASSLLDFVVVAAVLVVRYCWLVHSDLLSR